MDDVIDADVAEVPDPEDLALQLALAASQDEAAGLQLLAHG